MKKYKRFMVKPGGFVNGQRRFDIIDQYWDKKSTVFVSPGAENPVPTDTALAWVYGEGQTAEGGGNVYQLQTDGVFGQVVEVSIVPSHWFFI